jgi:hypothetical protein
MDAFRGECLSLYTASECLGIASPHQAGALLAMPSSLNVIIAPPPSICLVTIARRNDQGFYPWWRAPFVTRRASAPPSIRGDAMEGDECNKGISLLANSLRIKIVSARWAIGG